MSFGIFYTKSGVCTHLFPDNPDKSWNWLRMLE